MRAGDPPVRVAEARIASLQWSFVQWQGTCLIRSLCGFKSRSSDFRSGFPGTNACRKEVAGIAAMQTIIQMVMQRTFGPFYEGSTRFYGSSIPVMPTLSQWESPLR